jgi:tRNA dimethylallyltransferase
MNSSQNKTLIVIGGPTGVGKSTMAIKLAQHLKTEVINSDSRQIYAELNIGVNKPTPDDLLKVPHHLIGHVSIHDEYNAGTYESDALKAIDQVFLNHQTAILVGGTGLYIRAVTEGLDDFPDIDSSIKKTVAEIYALEGLSGLQQKVGDLDPDYYDAMDKDNPRRLLRALEVILQSGNTYSEQRSKKIKSRPFKIIRVFMDEDRTFLYQQIVIRVEQMITSGLEQEALKLYPYKHLKSLQTVGYSEWFDYFDGKCTKSEAIQKIMQHTRNYAKRQWTWWKPLGWPTFRGSQTADLIRYVDNQLIQ